MPHLCKRLEALLECKVGGKLEWRLNYLNVTHLDVFSPVHPVAEIAPGMCHEGFRVVLLLS